MPSPIQLEVSANNTAVFVVHGRNDALARSMFDFLRAIGLKPMEWDRGVALTESGSPYVGEVLDAAFQHVRAVVVLLTPDEIAYLQPRYASSDDDPETRPAEQARPNVLFEAGMALARHPRRTVLVEIGSVRPFSDIAGRHTIRLTNDAAKRRELAGRLETAGCAVNLEGSGWEKAGDFTPPNPAGGGLPLGRRVPHALQSKKLIDFDARFEPRGGAGGRLRIVNRGSATAYEVKVTAPEGSTLEFMDSQDIAKIPGDGKSVTLRVIDRFRNRWASTEAARAFDLQVSAKTEAGDEFSQDVFVDMSD